MAYLVHILILILIFVILAESLDLVAGHTGLLSVCQAGFFGVGAYCSALLTTRLAASFLEGLLAGIVVSVALSLVVSVPSLRLKDDYFVIGTFGLQVIVFGILNNWISLTRGPMGVPGIPLPVILGWHCDSQLDFLFLGGVFTLFAYSVMFLIVESPFGRVLHAIREDEIFAETLGKDTLRFKLIAFAVSASVAASAGSLYAHYVTYVDPSSFTVIDSILVISMVIIGGAGSAWGPLIGASVLVMLPEALRFIGLPNAAAGNLRQMIYGVLLVVMMIFRPRGLVGKYALSK